MPCYTSLGIMPSPTGIGVYIQRRVPIYTRLLEFSGRPIDRERLNRIHAGGGSDGFLQIDEHVFIGLSGWMDDYVNHSCDPNCGLDFEDGRVFLKSIKTLQRGQELTFDYATSQLDYPFRFDCCCGSPHCRGEVGDFDELPADRHRYYLSHGVIAPYLRERVPAIAAGAHRRRIPPPGNRGKCSTELR